MLQNLCLHMVPYPLFRVSSCIAQMSSRLKPLWYVLPQVKRPTNRLCHIGLPTGAFATPIGRSQEGGC
jgi:hypothetical protein